jgi:hypothetical protein
VSSVIGFILLFGILVIAFVGYQAQVVPQQNAETEFEHFQENRNELIDLRSAILTAGTSDRPQFPTIKLGTNYQTRILAINGPPPAGLLQTSDPYPINISDGSTNVVIQTRFLEYQPGYYEIGVGSTWYENSVLYLNATESGGGRVVIEDQNLVTDGDTLRITALQNDFQRSGTNRITLELYPTTVEGDISELAEDEELTVELPTRLSSDYWVGQFNNSSSVAYSEFNDSEFEAGVNELTLTVDSIDNLELNTVGIREEPTEDPAKNIDLDTIGVPVQEQTGSFSGTVLDDKADPVIEEVTFTDENGNTLGTDIPDTGDGSYLIEGIEEGSYDITASADGFEDDTVGNVEIVAGEETENVNFTLVGQDTNQLPAGAVAFSDENGDEEYNNGEPTYSESELETENFAGIDLIIVRDVMVGSLDINARSIIIDDGATIMTEFGTASFEANGGTVLVRGTIDTSDNTGAQVNINAAEIEIIGGTIETAGRISLTTDTGPITIDTATIDTTAGPGASIEITSNGDMVMTDSTILSAGSISITSEGGDGTFDGSTIDTSAGSGASTTITVQGSLSGVGMEVLSSGPIGIESVDNDLNVNSALLDVTEGSQASITLTTGNEMFLEAATLVGDQFSTFRGNRDSNGRNVFVEGAVFERGNGDPKEFDVVPGTRRGGGSMSPQNVNGAPAKGTVI